MTETPALNLEYEYKARNPNQLVLLLEDNQLLHKLAKNFAVRITCLSQHMITVYEQVVALLKPAEVSLLYSMDHRGDVPLAAACPLHSVGGAAVPLLRLFVGHPES